MLSVYIKDQKGVRVVDDPDGVQTILQHNIQHHGRSKGRIIPDARTRRPRNPQETVVFRIS